MIDFLIIYEHKAREYDNVLLLKKELEKRGYIVCIELAGLLDYSKYRKEYKPKVIVTYSLYNNFSIISLVLSVVGSVKKVVNLQWEQLFQNNDEQIKLHVPREEAKKAVHVCWGNSSYNNLIKNDVKNCVITGAIQLDFLKPSFSTYFNTREEITKEYNIRKNGRIILYISSFNATNLPKKEEEILIKEIGSSYQKIV